jgi:hypothetical protein
VVTNPEYLDYFRDRVAEFRCGGSNLNLQFYGEGVLDVGGTYANDLLLTAPLTNPSAERVAEFLRSQVNEDVAPGMAGFGYSRFLDVAASNALDVPVLAHCSEVIFIPGVQLPISESLPVNSPTTSISTPTTPAKVTAVYILNATGVTRLELKQSGRDQAVLIDTSRKVRPAALLTELVGSQNGDQPAYHRFSAITPIGRPSPTNFGWAPDAGISYTAVKDLGVASAMPTTDFSSDSAVVVTAAPLGTASASSPDSTQTTKQGLKVPQVEVEYRWGFPPLMQFPYDLAKGSVSADACQGSIDNAFAIANAANMAVLGACIPVAIKLGALCGPFAWICIPAGVAACGAAHVATFFWLRGRYNTARVGCGIRVQCGTLGVSCATPYVR